MPDIDLTAFEALGAAFGGISGSRPEYSQVTIPTRLIDPHPSNREVTAAQVKKLAESILRDGLGQLPLVREMPGGRYQAISGHHRIAAFRYLEEETGDSKWAAIPCTLLAGVDDRRARMLLHTTNLGVAALTPEERGRAYEELAEDIRVAREANPEAFVGVKTNDMIAALAAEQGQPAGRTTVKKYRRIYRDSLQSGREGSAKAGPGRPKAEKPRLDRAYSSTDRLHRAVEVLEQDEESLRRAIEGLEAAESLDPAALAKFSARLDRYATRIRNVKRRVDGYVQG